MKNEIKYFFKNGVALKKPKTRTIMKTEKQIKSKRYILLKELKDIRRWIDNFSRNDMKARQRGETVHLREKEKKLMGKIDSLNWILNEKL